MALAWIRVGALLAALAVGTGAFGAHALKERLTPEELDVWRTAVTYHLAHGLGVVLCGLIGARRAAGALALGVFLFSGSLYGLALGGPSWLGPVTPLGGVLFMVGWVLLAWRPHGGGGAGERAESS